MHGSRGTRKSMATTNGSCMICSMEARDIEARLLAHYGIRVDSEMSGYVVRQLQQAGTALRELPVIGGEAKTGSPRRLMIDPMMLQQPAP